MGLEQRQPYFDPDIYALADDLATVAAIAAAKITKAGDTGIGSLRIGDDSQSVPTSLFDRYLCIAGVSYSSGQLGGLVLQGYGGGNETLGEIVYAGGGTVYARTTGFLSIAANGGTAYQRFYVKTAGIEVLAMELVGAGKANFGDLTGSAAADVRCRNYSNAALSIPLYVSNHGTSVNSATALGCTFSSTNGTVIVGGSIQFKKTVNDSTTTLTSDSIISVNRASASQTETFFVRGLGGVAERTRTSASNPTTTEIPTGLSMWWFNTTLSELRYWYNNGGTLQKTDAFTLT